MSARNMKTFILLLSGSFFFQWAYGQKTAYDLMSFAPPKGWSREDKPGSLIFTRIDNARGSWCRISVVKSTTSKGNIDADFDSEWKELVTKNYEVKEAPELTPVEEDEGWKAKAGVGKFTFNKAEAVVMLTTLSGYERCASIVAVTNDAGYMKDIQALLESVEMKKPAASTNIPPAPKENNYSSAFHFSTTNFDDGWTSNVKEDWVEVTKGPLRVLLHYPNPKTIIPADPEPVINNAWNILVAPRYSDLKEYRTASTSLDYIRPYLGCGMLRDNATGKQVFVVLFRKGDSGWIEYISPDKKSFVDSYGMDPYMMDWQTASEIWNRLSLMANYNKFAVAASDLKGKWTSDYSGMLNYYNSYTGSHTATSVHQSSETFDFTAGNNYSWKLLAINGVIGSVNYSQADNTGKFSVPNNWQISFSNIERKPKTYDAYFTCIKGGRLLWMQDANYKTGFTAFGLAK